MAWESVYWVQPVSEPEEFWADVDDDPIMVVVLEVLTPGSDQSKVEIFSTVDRMRAYVDREDIENAVVYAKRIDEPDWPDRLRETAN